MDGVAMKLAIVVILSVLAYFVWTWWKNRKASSSTTETYVAPPSMIPPSDPVPQGPGIIMYGTNGCPWCTKQKEYFSSKNIEYEFKDCDTGACPSFVTGYPTIVKDGKVMPGYQEL